MPFATPSLPDIAGAVAKHPAVFHNTFFHLQATTVVGQPTQHHAPTHLVPLFAVLAGTAFLPEAVDEALVGVYQLVVVVGFINCLAPHPQLARAVLPSLLKQLAQREHDTACDGKPTLAELAGGVSWDSVMQHVSWDDVPVCLLALTTQERDRNQCLRLKWCLQALTVSAPVLKQVLQASLASASVIEVCSPFSVQFGRLVSSGDFKQSELLDLVKCLTEGGDTGGISHTRNCGGTALHVVCEKGYEDVALCMLRHVDARLVCGMVSPDGYTPLVSACKAGLTAVAMAMLDLGVAVCNIQAVDKDKDTALHWACYKGLTDVALRLLRCEGARRTLSMIDNYSETPFLLACWRGLGDVAMAMLELDAAACTIQAVDQNKDTALHWACDKGLADVVLRLLGCEGARDMLSLDYGGSTPLLVACSCGLGDVAMAMLELDATACTVEAVDTYKHTALHWACYKGLANVAQRLLRCEGARRTLSMIDNYSETPFLLACAHGLGDVATAMLELDAAACTIQAVDKNKDTALHWTCDKGLADVALRLLRCEGARHALAVVNSNGCTPLLVACAHGLGDVAMTMLELHATARTVESVDKNKGRIAMGVREGPGGCGTTATQMRRRTRYVVCCQQ